MKILLIGNGFDLAHNLPTQYNDFLDVCEGVENELLPAPPVNARYEDFRKTVSLEDYKRFRDLVKNNVWVGHFRSERSRLGKQWGDFETGIQFAVCSIRKSEESSDDDVFRLNILSKLHQLIYKKCGRGRCTYKMAYACLSRELDELAHALEVYFSLYVGKKETERQALFMSLGVDKLLSFNYTTTFNDNYIEFQRERFEWCYIHGRAGDSLKSQKCGLVLGFDDHYLEEGRAIINTVPFEKYYQRIVKCADNKYFQWIEEIEETKENSELYIFGHSLSPSDGDILRRFITSVYVKTIVFYREDSDDRAEKVANLAIVLGPDELIKLAGGSQPKIEFRPI